MISLLERYIGSSVKNNKYHKFETSKIESIRIDSGYTYVFMKEQDGTRTSIGLRNIEQAKLLINRVIYN